MRKTLAFLLALTVAFSMVACGAPSEDKTPDTEKPSTETQKPADEQKPSGEAQTPANSTTALDTMNKVWELVVKEMNGYTDEQKEMFGLSVFGGSSFNPVDGAPAKYEIDQATLDAQNEELRKGYEDAGILDMFEPETQASLAEKNLGMTEAIFNAVDDSASLFDYISSTRLTFAVHHVKSSDKLKEVADGFVDSYTHMPYMCFLPERLIVATDGDYVFVLLGITDYLDLFYNNIKAAYPNVSLVYDDAPMDLSWWDDGLM